MNGNSLKWHLVEGHVSLLGHFSEGGLHLQVPKPNPDGRCKVSA